MEGDRSFWEGMTISKFDWTGDCDGGLCLGTGGGGGGSWGGGGG